MDNFETKDIDKHVDIVLDSAIAECSESEDNELMNVPSQDSEEEIDRLRADIAGYGNPEEEEDEYPPGPQDGEGGVMAGLPMGEQITFILKEEEYKEFFKSMMDKEGISSLKDLPEDKKKEFFNKVDAAWKAKNETD